MTVEDLCLRIAVHRETNQIKEDPMSVSDLQLQLNTLREQLEQNPQLTLEERGNLTEVMEQIQAQIELETVSQDPSISDGVNLAVERFEVDHPTIAGTLRNVLVTLGSMGI